MTERTIPDEAWEHVGNSIMLDGYLYPDTISIDDESKSIFIADSEDEELINWLRYFTMDNYNEWVGAAIVCPRAPSLSGGVFFRFDDKDRFVSHGYTNPYRETGYPDWYFFWTRYHTKTKLHKFAIAEGFLPAESLELGTGGYGIGTGLRGERDGLVLLDD